MWIHGKRPAEERSFEWHRHMWDATNAEFIAAWGADPVATVVMCAMSGVGRMVARCASSVLGSAGRLGRWNTPHEMGASEDQRRRFRLAGRSRIRARRGYRPAHRGANPVDHPQNRWRWRGCRGGLARSPVGGRFVFPSRCHACRRTQHATRGEASTGGARIHRPEGGGRLGAAFIPLSPQRIDGPMRANWRNRTQANLEAVSEAKHASSSRPVAVAAAVAGKFPPCSRSGSNFVGQGASDGDCPPPMRFVERQALPTHSMQHMHGVWRQRYRGRCCSKLRGRRGLRLATECDRFWRHGMLVPVVGRLSAPAADTFCQ